ncbi:MAG: polysaccharide pyruvyl transferase family protein [Eubacterium sp.]|nr:polysaccharide pyruvyl transferase family protein [Eubacterium sp.]
MKISINSTFSYIKFNLNYGSALQCYALQQYLKNRGHDASHIRDYRANPAFLLPKLKNIRYFKQFRRKVGGLIKLQGFIRKNLSLSERGYISYASMVKHCPEADCHIAGSDQIWKNANNFRYLTYVPDDKLKLSYAASFGRKEISDEMKAEIKPYLERLDGISVREKSGVDIINSIGFDAVHVLDPTMLLDFEQYPYSENGKSNYYYCYFLNLKDRNSVPFDAIKSIAKDNGRDYYLTAPLNYYLFRDEDVRFPSVEDWLGFYKNADCVFTNTFHGLLFCIIFKKQFVHFLQDNNENERFYSVLSTLGLENRLLNNPTREQIEAVMNDKIDYAAVYEKINKQRKVTDEFFKRFGI